MPTLTLYQRDDCHLCDLALAELAAVGLSDFDSVFIDGDAAFEARFGLRVPVLVDARSARELNWPFDASGLRAWLANGITRGGTPERNPARTAGVSGERKA